MFDFFKKRRYAATTLSTPAEQATSVDNAALAQARQQAREQAKQEAAALQDEAAALPFIVRCGFADARLQASNAGSQNALLAQALFVVIWSTGFIVAKFGLPYAPPLTFLVL